MSQEVKVEVEASKKAFKTNVHSIKVTGDDTAKREEIDAFVKTIVSKNKVGTSDTLTVTWRLYTSKTVSDFGVIDLPKVQKEFYSQSITPRRMSFVLEKVNGKNYYAVNLSTLILQAKTEGVKRIVDGTVEVIFSVPTGKRVKTFVGDVDEMKKETRSLRVEGFTIEVMDLVEI